MERIDRQLRSITLLISLILVLGIGEGCQSRKDAVAILSRTLQKQGYSNTSAPEDMGNTAGLSGTMYFVEGQVQNKGTVDIHHLMISFPCKAGVEHHVLTVEIPLLPAGKTLDFKTRPYQSVMAVSLLEDEEPDITMDR